MIHLQALGWSGFGFPSRTLRLLGPDGPQLWRLRPEDGSVGWIGPAKLEGGTLTVTGWARHPQGNVEVTRRVLVVGNDAIYGDAEIVEDRPDVATFLKNPAYQRSGWTLRREGVAAPSQPTLLRAYLVFADGVLVPLDGTSKLEEVR
jgi:hypothetical protein